MKPTRHIVIFNRAPAMAQDGWIHIVPKGELPNTEAGIVQVLDDQSLDAILANIEKDKNRQGDKWPGIYAGREHFIYDAGQDSAALGWFKEFQKRGDGIWAKSDGLTPGGEAAIANREYKFTSFVADPSDLKKVTGGNGGNPDSESGPKYRVMKIETVGFTNYANGKELLTPITNRLEEDRGLSQSAALDTSKPQRQPGTLRVGTTRAPNIFASPDESGPADSKQTTAAATTAALNRDAATKAAATTKGKMKTVCTLLGLSADADESSVHAAVTKLLNRGEITPEALTALRTEHTALKADNQMLLGEQVDGILAEHKITEEKIINRVKPLLLPLKNRADRVAFLTELGIGGPQSKGTATATRVLNRGTGHTATHFRQQLLPELLASQAPTPPRRLPFPPQVHRPPVTTIQHMINRPGIFETQLSGQALAFSLNSPNPSTNMHLCGTDPFIAQSQPGTVTNSTDSTGGAGAGLLRWDANYLYVSVGTNLWKRSSLTSW